MPAQADSYGHLTNCNAEEMLPIPDLSFPLTGPFSLFNASFPFFCNLLTLYLWKQLPFTAELKHDQYVPIQ